MIDFTFYYFDTALICCVVLREVEDTLLCWGRFSQSIVIYVFPCSERSACTNKQCAVSPWNDRIEDC